MKIIAFDVPYILTAERFGKPVGTMVYRQQKYDYGLASDDTRQTGVQHVSMTLNADGDYPGFTVPAYQLQEVEPA